MAMNFCSQCGVPLKFRVPPGDDRPRFVCDDCHTIHYENPKMVVGCIAEWENSILLCRRAIEPRYGLWTIPAGYLENGETLFEGVKREALEEACANLEILTLYTIFNLTQINQVYFIFRARLLERDYLAGAESLEVKLFKEEEIPWNHLAFRVVMESLKLYFRDRPTGLYPLHIGNIPPP